jgi:hypothetical protein
MYRPATMRIAVLSLSHVTRDGARRWRFQGVVVLQDEDGVVVAPVEEATTRMEADADAAGEVRMLRHLDRHGGKPCGDCRRYRARHGQRKRTDDDEVTLTMHPIPHSNTLTLPSGAEHSAFPHLVRQMKPVS